MSSTLFSTGKIGLTTISQQKPVLLFASVACNSDVQFVAKRDASAEDVQVARGGWVEGACIESGALLGAESHCLAVDELISEGFGEHD